ncbi:MAG: UDP-3-O-(3-hydroxymyristoyl)glucosamine N-acyltransferase [Candidatus Omnitrophica bacterium]|nr:UDP-3-O-(3-hydroxymyristoyl)glucosamine N-acyltransferase [Candidatus Omnitrophota bacterium]
MAKTLGEIARFVNGELVGDAATPVSGVAGIEDAREGDITFLASPKYAAFLSRTAASAVIVGRDVSVKGKPVIRTDNPSLAFVKAVSFLFPQQQTHFEGIHASASIAKGVKLGKKTAVGAFVVIEEGSSVGDNTVIYPHTYVGRDCSIGKDALIYANVSIRERTAIGDRVIIQNGAVIGSDGFGFVTINGRHEKIPQVGCVVIEDDVEIGANTTIDRARFDKTVIGAGTKIDNLVQIAHNVTIGKNCLIVAQTGIAGSAAIGNNVIMAGQSASVGHVTIGDNSVVMARSGVSKSLAPGSIVWGTPAQPADEEKKARVLYQNLPKLFDTVKELKKQLEKKDNRG